MKDIGEADVIIGIRIKHESNGIAISLSYYIEKVLKKCNYLDCTLVSTPMGTSEKMMPNNGEAVSNLSKLSRYTSNPSTQHWQAIKRVLKYSCLVEVWISQKLQTVKSEQTRTRESEEFKKKPKSQSLSQLSSTRAILAISKSYL
ncbi:hypothetical protein Tco_1275510 [Tanacetum coccineum]